MKVNILSTRPKRCGIGITNQYTIEGMEPFLKKNNISKKRIFIKHPFSKNILYFMWLGWKTARKCDLIHIHYNHDCFGKIGRFYGFQNFFTYLFASTTHKPIITTFHENPDLSRSSKLRKTLYKWLSWSPLHISKKVIVTTSRTKKQLIEQYGISESKIWLLPLGSFKDVKAVPKRIAKEELGLEEKKIITLFGFIDTNKGHHRIMDIIKDLPESYHFLIAGDARTKKGKQYKKRLLNQLIKNGLEDKITFFGSVKRRQFPWIIGATDILVFPYDNITSSLALTTAISYRKPILTSDIEPFKIFKKQHGSIILFDLRNRNDLLKKIQQLTTSNQLKKKLSKEMRLFIKKNNWYKIGKKQIEIYKIFSPTHALCVS